MIFIGFMTLTALRLLTPTSLEPEWELYKWVAFIQLTIMGFSLLSMMLGVVFWRIGKKREKKGV